MKILMFSCWFYPSLGGSEKSADLLAREFTRMGHEVKLVTRTAGTNIAPDGLEYPFEVIRQPNYLKLFDLVHWCNVYFHNGISLRNAWPLLFIRKPWVVRHQSWIRCLDGTLTGIGGSPSGWNARLKHFLVRFSVSTSVSQAIANHLNRPSTVIPSPYHDDLFRVIPGISRTKEMVFLGRLVSEKGLAMLLEALAVLKQHGITSQLTVVGSGPEESRLRQKTRELEITEQVVFLGFKVGEELVQILNQHQIMIVPSLYDEPGGGVALEGIACGCVVIGSEGGGLRDYIGPCGTTFPNGDVKALAKTLSDLLTHPDKLSIYRLRITSHLLGYTKAEVAKAYLQVIEAAIKLKSGEVENLLRNQL